MKSPEEKDLTQTMYVGWCRQRQEKANRRSKKSVFVHNSITIWNNLFNRTSTLVNQDNQSSESEDESADSNVCESMDDDDEEDQEGPQINPPDKIDEVWKKVQFTFYNNKL